MGQRASDPDSRGGGRTDAEQRFVDERRRQLPVISESRTADRLCIRDSRPRLVTDSRDPVSTHKAMLQVV